MREIKFRGYDIDNAVWRYSNGVVFYEIDGFGIDIHYYNIAEDSIGQYTGFCVDCADWKRKAPTDIERLYVLIRYLNKGILNLKERILKLEIKVDELQERES